MTQTVTNTHLHELKGELLCCTQSSGETDAHAETVIKPLETIGGRHCVHILLRSASGQMKELE